MDDPERSRVSACDCGTQRLRRLAAASLDGSRERRDAVLAIMRAMRRMTTRLLPAQRSAETAVESGVMLPSAPQGSLHLGARSSRRKLSIARPSAEMAVESGVMLSSAPRGMLRAACTSTCGRLRHRLSNAGPSAEMMVDSCVELAPLKEVRKRVGKRRQRRWRPCQAPRELATAEAKRAIPAAHA